MEMKFNHQIFFYCCPFGSPEKQPYHHGMVCLAEGFKALGIQFFSNINYWQHSPEEEKYLLCHEPTVIPDDCSVVVLDHDYFRFNNNSLPENLFHPNRKYITVYLDCDDGTKTTSFDSQFREFDFIFKTHYNSKSKYPKNFHPWAFGLSERILLETKCISSFQNRKRHLLVNFRHKKAGHPVRNISCKEFFPILQKVLPINDSTDNLDSPPMDKYHYLQWFQTGRRHYPSYYKCLKESVACACFGGFFVSQLPQDHSILISRLIKRVFSQISLKSNIIAQWDSWRLWESLAAGCATFHVDFKKYGFLLPVMPENWKHYVGIDLDNIQEAVNRIADEPEILEKISTEGRLWALEHYSPVPTSRRFLETVCNKL